MALGNNEVGSIIKLQPLLYESLTFTTNTFDTEHSFQIIILSEAFYSLYVDKKLTDGRLTLVV